MKRVWEGVLGLGELGLGGLRVVGVGGVRVGRVGVRRSCHGSWGQGG